NRNHARPFDTSVCLDSMVTIDDIKAVTYLCDHDWVERLPVILQHPHKYLGMLFKCSDVCTRKPPLKHVVRDVYVFKCKFTWEPFVYPRVFYLYSPQVFHRNAGTYVNNPVFSHKARPRTLEFARESREIARPL